jgi:hypothetical protein
MKRYAPAAQRNIGPIGDVLEQWLPACGTVLEVASGSGEHGLAFAQRFPALQWQPSDPDANALASIAAWQDDQGTDNFLPPVALDAASALWPVAHADAVVAINMVHISPWAASIGLFRGAGHILARDAPLILYGPYVEQGVETAPSNLAFDQSLKSRNSSWGLRDVAEMDRLAGDHGFVREGRTVMPSNNIMLIYRRATMSG